MKLKLREITEGETRLLVPETGELTKKSPVFFNPEMELSRDISVAIVKITEPETFCDLLSGSGARGIRIANETTAKVLANDINPMAYDLIKRNKELNSLDLEVTNLEGNLLLAGKRFDFIDIDPFGSPVHFIDSALRSVNKKGILAVTATDTAALCGTYPRACLRKYDALSLRTDYYNELGLRILMGYITRSAMRYEKGIKPLFSHCTRHYFRTYLQVLGGRSHAIKSLRNIAFIQHCFSCLEREFVTLDKLKSDCQCGADIHTAGPLWIGKFADSEFCRKLKGEIGQEYFGKSKEAVKLIDKIRLEQEVTKPYYNIHKVSKKMKTTSKPTNEIIEALQKRGFNAVRTHFSDLGLRTDADISEISDIISYDIK